jgi:hypothetical protein
MPARPLQRLGGRLGESHADGALAGEWVSGCGAGDMGRKARVAVNQSLNIGQYSRTRKAGWGVAPGLSIG